MRQIDNMTPQELDTLALKGMTAPRTASERNKAKPKIVVRRDMTPDYEREAKRDADRNKAQHSPLPWKVAHGIISDHPEIAARGGAMCVADGLGNGPEAEANAALIVRAVNHADKLAERLRELSRLVHQNNALQHAGIEVSPEAWGEMYQATSEAKAALSAYQAAQ